MFKTTLALGLLGILLFGDPVQAQSLRDVAISAARVDRTDQNAVLAVQIQLQEFGYYLGPIDGIFGQQTFNAAVAAVQDVNKEAALQRVNRTASPQESTGRFSESDDDAGGGSDENITASASGASSTPSYSGSSGSSTYGDPSSAFPSQGSAIPGGEVKAVGVSGITLR